MLLGKKRKKRNSPPELITGSNENLLTTPENGKHENFS